MSDEVNGAAHINMLPDEILVQIMSHLKPADLLGPIAVVCHRWYDLTRRKEPWRHAELKYCDSTFCWRNEQNHNSFMRVARRAPFLNVLDIHQVFYDLGQRKIKDIFNTLLKADCEVRGLVLDSVVHQNYSLLLKLLLKYSPTLRYLKVRLEDRLVSCAKNIEIDERNHSILTIIRDMPKLRSFDVIDSTLPTHLYNGEFSEGFPVLQKLKWNQAFTEDYNKEAEPFLLDILENSSKTLTDVSWGMCLMYCKVPDPLLDKLGKCQNMRHFRTPWQGMALIEKMPKLEKITLHLYRHTPSTQLKTLHKVIVESNTIQKIKEFNLWAVDVKRSCFNDRVNSLLKAIGERCGPDSNLKIFHLSEEWKPKALSDLLKKMPQLEELHLGGCEGITIPHLQLIEETMPSLTYLDVSNMTVPLHRMEQLATVINHIYSTHPKLTLRLHESVSEYLDNPTAPQFMHRYNPEDDRPNQSSTDSESNDEYSDDEEWWCFLNIK